MSGKFKGRSRPGNSPPTNEIRVLPPITRPMSEEEQKEALEALRQLLLEHLDRKARRGSVSQVGSKVRPRLNEQEDAS